MKKRRKDAIDALLALPGRLADKRAHVALVGDRQLVGKRMVDALNRFAMFEAVSTDQLEALHTVIRMAYNLGLLDEWVGPTVNTPDPTL